MIAQKLMKKCKATLNSKVNQFKALIKSLKNCVKKRGKIGKILNI